MLLRWGQASEQGPRPWLAEAAPTVTVRLGESPKTPGSATSLSIPLRHAPARRRRQAPTSQERMVVATIAPATDDTIGADVELEPLASIAPIAIPAVRPTDITPADIAITPLAPIAELQIAPLSRPRGEIEETYVEESRDVDVCSGLVRRDAGGPGETCGDTETEAGGGRGEADAGPGEGGAGRAGVAAEYQD